MDVITTHKNVDFDALASVVAASHLYPDARIVLPRSINANVRAFLSIHKDLFPVLSPWNSATTRSPALSWWMPTAGSGSMA